jgi:hypothetical protein
MKKNIKNTDHEMTAIKHEVVALLKMIDAESSATLLEYEHIIGSSLGLFFGVVQNVEFLNRIDQVRLRHFITVGVRLGM